MVKIRIFWTEFSSPSHSSFSKLSIIEANNAAWASYSLLHSAPKLCGESEKYKSADFSSFLHITFQNVSYFAENQNSASPCDEMTKLFR